MGMKKTGAVQKKLAELEYASARRDGRFSKLEKSLADLDQALAQAQFGGKKGRKKGT